jgi:hypothetical protein
MDKFSDFIKIAEAVEKHGAIIISESSLFDLLPNIDLPTVRKTARIEQIMDKKNPIYIGLSDGTKLFMTYDEFRRIEGKPERGKNMIVVMQRHNHDSSNYPSLITKCIIEK